MDIKQLKQMGRLLCGAGWQTELSELLDVSDRTVRRWVAGDSEIPAGVKTKMIELLRKRKDEIDRYLK